MLECWLISEKLIYNLGYNICVACDTTETCIWHWHHNGERDWEYKLCHACYQRYILGMRYSRINFKGKQILVKENPRTGQCSVCSRKGLTHMHHKKYDIANPLKYTVELCPSCHGKEKRRKKTSPDFI